MIIINLPEFGRLQYSVFKVSSLQLQRVFETGVQERMSLDLTCPCFGKWYWHGGQEQELCFD